VVDNEKLDIQRRENAKFMGFPWRARIVKCPDECEPGSRYGLLLDDCNGKPIGTMKTKSPLAAAMVASMLKTGMREFLVDG